VKKGKTFIIAEAGVNHNGDAATAKRLIDAACYAGADAIKFQTYSTEKMVSRSAPKAEYQKKRTGSRESHFDMLKRFELGIKTYKDLLIHCRKKGILFLSTPFDLESIDLLHKLGLEMFKIPSGEITNLPYLRKIGSMKKKVLLSTGMSDLGEIEDALNILVESGTKKGKITVLHCTTEYPAPVKDVNLMAMVTIRDAFQVDVGYSDHTSGIEIPVAAVAMGATVIEKHFTLDRKMQGPDHAASLEPEEFRLMVKSIRNTENALGSSIKQPSLREMKNKDIVRKSIVAVDKIKKGEIFTEDNIAAKRPGTGISPMEWERVVGRKAMRDFVEDEAIEI
jgi:N,N'-diacetyllegionaminate synthase